MYMYTTVYVQRHLFVVIVGAAQEHLAEAKREYSQSHLRKRATKGGSQIGIPESEIYPRRPVAGSRDGRTEPR